MTEEVKNYVEIVQEPLEKIFSDAACKIILKQVMSNRRVSQDDKVMYLPVDYPLGDTTYVISGQHIPIEETLRYARSNCKECNSKGYKVIEIIKNKIPNPQDFVILSKVSLEGMSEEQKKIWLEKEKKNPVWRVMVPCRCAVKNIQRKTPNIYANEMGNIVIKILYTKKGNEK